MTDDSARLQALKERIREFVREREWDRFHDPKNLAMALASEVGELLAELRWVSNTEADESLADPGRRERVEREVGDVTIALLLFCDRIGIDLIAAAERKVDINEMNYPSAASKGRADRPRLATKPETISRIIAIDWSGVAAGGHDTIWMAEVRGGELTRLENGRSRTQVVDHLIELAKHDPDIVVGLDFAFAFPRWFSESHAINSIEGLWQLVASEGETWLSKCPDPFWGRPGVSKPALESHFRETEAAVAEHMKAQPKSVFQIGGAGAVGTGSIRGMPELLRLRNAGFSIWPFDAPRRPLVVEIYPRLLTGPIVKSNADARLDYVTNRFAGLPDQMRLRAASSEDAFDAAVSALTMYEHEGELANLQPGLGKFELEGMIWSPGTNKREG
jgi:NTP pyrophosphatase (non-canonical NTP hydrolase)